MPLILAEIGWMSMGIVDTVMVGRLPNSAIAIGATGLGQSLYHSLAIFGGGLLLGLDTLVAQAYGREDLPDARHSLVNGMFLAFVMTPLFMFAISFWPGIMQRFGISPELVEPMRPFLRALNWGTLPLLAYFALRRYLQAVNVATPIMFAVVSANLVNALGNWVLIYGHLGFRAMGITGSGWSTSLSRVYMVLVLALTLLWVERKRPRLEARNGIRIDGRRIWGLLKFGVPAATQILLEIGAFSAASALAAKLGPVPLSGHEIAINCAALTFMVPLGLSSAASVRVGHELGRNDTAGARRAGWSAIVLAVAFMSCSGLLFVSASRLIARLFDSRSCGDRSGRTASPGRRRVPDVRWLAECGDRRPAWRRRNQNAHDRQLHRLLADRAACWICALLSDGLGCAGHLGRIVHGTHADRYRPAVHLEQAEPASPTYDFKIDSRILA